MKDKNFFNYLNIGLLIFIILTLFYILYINKLTTKEKPVKLNKEDIEKIEKKLDEMDINLDDVLDELDE